MVWQELLSLGAVVVVAVVRTPVEFLSLLLFCISFFLPRLSDFHLNIFEPSQCSNNDIFCQKEQQGLILSYGEKRSHTKALNINGFDMNLLDTT